MATREEIDRVKRMLVGQLRLRMEASAIDDEAPLFETLGLDSVDAIELVAGIEKVFGVVIESEEEALEAFASVTVLTDHLAGRGAFAP